MIKKRSREIRVEDEEKQKVHSQIFGEGLYSEDIVKLI